MTDKFSEAIAKIQSKLEKRISEEREDLARRVEEQRVSREKEYQATISGVEFYMTHLSGICQRIVDEGNPFTRKNILDIYAPLEVLGRIHGSIFDLGTELADEQTGELELYNHFKVGDLDKLRELRKNTSRDLGKLVDDDSIYGAVALGFVEVSPEAVSSASANVSKANSFLIAYKNAPLWRKLKLCGQISEKRKLVDPEREVELDYVLTPLGKAAVLPIDRTYACFGEKIFN